MVTTATDQNGTIYVEFSPDGGDNIDSTLSFAYDTARINVPHILTVGAGRKAARSDSRSMLSSSNTAN